MVEYGENAEVKPGPFRQIFLVYGFAIWRTGPKRTDLGEVRTSQEERKIHHNHI